MTTTPNTLLTDVTDAAEERTDTAADARSSRPTVARLLAPILGLTALLALMLTAFAWPASELAPRGLPLVVVGPPAAATAMANQLDKEAASADAFHVTAVPDRAAAVAALRGRTAYGALVPGPKPELLTAPAASATVAQLLTQAAAQAAPGAAAPTVSAVVPLPSGDPRGILFSAGALPLVLGGIITGSATSIALPRTRQRLVAAGGVAIAAGLTLVGLLQGWFDALGGNYLANAAVVGLGIAAIAFPIIGLRHWLGMPGVGLGALTMLLIGNPLSGVTSAPELLPLGWLGQLLPPGATASALRGTAFFDGTGVWAPVSVLAVWALAGLGLALIPRQEAGAHESSSGPRRLSAPKTPLAPRLPRP